ncbi:MAG: hypothetical protein L3K10_05570 [Thermoplasmata archaeon]|nr:hypothetical protein [Thermoplasmata archaeon]
MVRIQRGQRLVPILLGAGMLAMVVAAGLSPSLGGVSAQSNCQYAQCPANSTSPFPWWIVAAIVVVVVIAALIGLFLFRRRPPTTPTSPEAWEPPAGAAPGGPTPPSTAPAVAGGAALGAAAVGPASSYVETPEDVGQVPPAVGAGAAAGAAAGEQEPDIDSLMAELDKISGEILKKAPKTGSGGSSGTEGTDETSR